ncbi:hypothetical protein FQA39_LY18440 [Lamprigera yunnana]|nr:hypothetical protein FQA39_LY18440 [Lamprigera yunnana]
MCFPFHKYSGPGNSLNLGKPVDDDDHIALVHDIHYSLSKSNEDIRKADEESILDFYRKFLTTGELAFVNWWYWIKGHSLYAARQKQLSNLYKQYKHSGESYRQFCQNIKEDTNLATGTAVESILYAPIAGSSFAHNRHGSGKSGITEDRTVPNNEYNFDSIFNMDNSEMDVQNDMDSTLSTTQGNRAGIDSSRGTGIIKLYKQPSVNRNVSNFAKCYTFYSYGYCVNRFDSPKRALHLTFANTNYFSTPLSYLLVDQICTYISKAEMDAIRGCNAYAIDCLNNKIPSNIVLYTTDAVAPIKPTGSKVFNPDDLVTRLYEDDAPAVMGVPRNNPYFMAIALNKELNEIIPPGTSSYVAHNNGMPLLNKFIDRFHVMSHVRQKVLEYNYKFHYAPCVDLCNGNHIDSVDNDIPTFNNRNVQQAKGGLVQVAKPVNAFNTTWSTGITRSYNQPIEQYYVLKTGSASNIVMEQPKAYIELFVIPKLNPALQSTDFQNLYFNSIYASEPLHATPDNLVAIPTRGSKNTGCQTICGYFDEGVTD